MSRSRSYDLVVVGAGIIGLTVARAAALKKFGRICLIEKEKKLGEHSSGRNSGVLHAGIYYSPGTLKAKLCASGAKRMFAYAQERGIPVKKTGKVIVATEPGNSGQIDVLHGRATANGVRVERIDPKRLKEIEPEAHTFGQALYSPDTAVIDPKKVLEALEKEVLELGVDLEKNSEAWQFNAKQRTVRTQKGSTAYGHLVNAGGLHADRIAHAMGVGGAYRILPFKGFYRKLTPSAAAKFRGSIYPVPDLEKPFLGVHVTRTIDDEVMLGPSAVPALGRENYGLLKGLDLRESPVMVSDLAMMVVRNTEGFRKMVQDEIAQYGLPGFLRAAQKLAPGLRAEDILPCSKTGIRAQLVDKKTKKLVMDLVIEDGPSSTHILNAVSPAFTSSLPFADLVVERLVGS